MAEMDLRERLTILLGPEKADQVLVVLEGEAKARCRDKDCVRLLPHPRLARHRWRHAALAPFDRSPIGWHCLGCGKPTWHRIHRAEHKES